jgi:hypothetical protein
MPLLQESTGKGLIMGSGIGQIMGKGRLCRGRGRGRGHIMFPTIDSIKSKLPDQHMYLSIHWHDGSSLPQMTTTQRCA